jgi:hypothetical protein
MSVCPALGQNGQQAAGAGDTAKSKIAATAERTLTSDIVVRLVVVKVQDIIPE